MAQKKDQVAPPEGLAEIHERLDAILGMLKALTEQQEAIAQVVDNIAEDVEGVAAVAGVWEPGKEDDDDDGA